VAVKKEGDSSQREHVVMPTGRQGEGQVVVVCVVRLSISQHIRLQSEFRRRVHAT